MKQSLFFKISEKYNDFLIDQRGEKFYKKIFLFFKFLCIALWISLVWVMWLLCFCLIYLFFICITIISNLFYFLLCLFTYKKIKKKALQYKINLKMGKDGIEPVKQLIWGIYLAYQLRMLYVMKFFYHFKHSEARDFFIYKKMMDECLDIRKLYCIQKDKLLSVLQIKMLKNKNLDEEKKRILFLTIQEEKTYPLNIFIVGPTGSGKSSTINAIFGDVIAKTCSTAKPETKEVVEFQRFGLNLIDSPGFGDGTDDASHIEKIKLFIQKKEKKNEKIDFTLFIQGNSRDYNTLNKTIDKMIPLLGEDYRRIYLKEMQQHKQEKEIFDAFSDAKPENFFEKLFFSYTNHIFVHFFNFFETECGEDIEQRLILVSNKSDIETGEIDPGYLKKKQEDLKKRCPKIAITPICYSARLDEAKSYNIPEILYIFSKYSYSKKIWGLEDLLKKMEQQQKN